MYSFGAGGLQERLELTSLAAMARAAAAGTQRLPRCGVALVAIACSLLAGTARAHLSAFCSATHALRPQTSTFLLASYHKSPNAGSSVPGTMSIKSPQGTTYEFAFNNFCAIPVDSTQDQNPVPRYDLSTSVTYYRERLLLACVCKEILGCGTYNAVTGMCTSLTGDCPTVAPKEVQIDCYGTEDDVPGSVGQAWGRLKGDDEKANCAYGSPLTGTDRDARTYVASLAATCIRAACAHALACMHARTHASTAHKT